MESLLPELNSMQVQNYPKFLKNPIVRHTAFWVLIIGFFTVPNFEFGWERLGWTVLMNICYTPVDMLAVYTTLYYLLPRLLKRKQILLNVFLYLLLTLTLSILSRFLKDHVLTFLPDDLVENKSWIGEYYRSTMILNMIVFVAVGLKLLMLWYDAQLRSQELANRQIQSELIQLRAQINPHFLFNTLNNIDNLVLHDSARASETLIQLSDILRYSLYDTSSDLVSLTKELEFLDNYVQLQRIRIDQNDFVEVKRSGSGDGLRIAPMLMIPLVENSFKHCYRYGESPGIRIQISIHEKELEFTTVNRINPDHSMAVKNPGGIGIQNLKRRLELQYPGKHDFEQSVKDNHFFTRLHLDLS